MNEKDLHDMEKLENLYQEVVEEGILGRAAAGIKATGQTAGKYVSGVGRALIGKANHIDAASFRLFYKLANVVQSFTKDIEKMTGVTGGAYKPVGILVTSLQEVARSNSPESGKAQDILNMYLMRTHGGKSQPATISDMERIITGPITNTERQSMISHYQNAHKKPTSHRNPPYKYRP